MQKYYTSIKSHEGFGAQYQKILQTYIYCNLNGLEFAYSPFQNVEHNYNNDVYYISKLESLINLKDNIININENMNYEHLDYGTIVKVFFDTNIDFCCNNEHMKFIKDCFWKNKNKNYFDNDKLNVAVHIRRENQHDNGQCGDRITTHNTYYLNIMNHLREKYKDKNILFHIYSQGNINNFMELISDDVVFYLNHDIVESFIGIVSADVLIISPSSFSYVAALISDGEVYYKHFWHSPKKEWHVCC